MLAATSQLSPFIEAVFEYAFNKILFQDQNLLPIYQKLNGKTLSFCIKEYPIPFILVFSEQRVDMLSGKEINADCAVNTGLSTLLMLRKQPDLTALIQQKKITLDGDLQILQYFSTLLDLSPVDPFELLAPYIGDVATEALSRLTLKLIASIKEHTHIAKKQLHNAFINEWQLVPHPLMLIDLADQIERLSQSTSAIEKRIQQLEQRHVSK